MLLVGRATNGLPQCLPGDRSASPGDVMESWLDPAWASSGQPCDVAASPGSSRPSRAWRGAERPPPGTRREARLRPRRCREPWPLYFRPGVPVPAPSGRGPAAPDPISGGVDRIWKPTPKDYQTRLHWEWITGLSLRKSRSSLTFCTCLQRTCLIL